jgi:hypothetical protein
LPLMPYRHNKLGCMSSEASNEMLSLLKELSVYKAMDEDYRAGAQGRMEAEAFDERERRRLEINLEIQNLAAESKKELF